MLALLIATAEAILYVDYEVRIKRGNSSNVTEVFPHLLLIPMEYLRRRFSPRDLRTW
jgi:hypothetical protein